MMKVYYAEAAGNTPHDWVMHNKVFTTERLCIDYFLSAWSDVEYKPIRGFILRETGEVIGRLRMAQLQVE